MSYDKLQNAFQNKTPYKYNKEVIFDGTKIIKRIVHNKDGDSHFKNPTKITESVDEENKRNILTIETINSSGLLVKIAEIFKNYEASIHSAKITTLGEKVEDTFFIEDLRTSLISKNKMQKIKKALAEII